VKIGQTVNVMLDAVPDRNYQGVVSQVGMIGDNNQGAVYFTVTVRLLDADAAVLPGMTAVADIQVELREDVLQVPSRAIQEDNGKRFVYLMENTGEQIVTRPVYIQVGLTSDTASEIISSELKEGDYLSAGAPIISTRPGWSVDSAPAGAQP
jgi:HlyD family secretion protein